MEALAALAGLLGAGAVQFFNRFKSNNTVLLKLSLCLIGLACYAIGNGLPQAWSGPVFLAWLSPAWLWAAAVPGLASLVGTLPNMGTNTK